MYSERQCELRVQIITCLSIESRVIPAPWELSLFREAIFLLTSKMCLCEFSFHGPTDTNTIKHHDNKHLRNEASDARRLTRQKESLVHGELFGKSDMAEVFLAFAYGGDIATLPEDLHDELLCGVLGQTADKHSLTSWGAVPCGRRWKVCSKVAEQRRLKTGIRPSG